MSSSRRSPAQVAQSVRKEMESHLTAQNYRGWHRVQLQELSIFTRQKKSRDATAANHSVSQSKV